MKLRGIAPITTDIKNLEDVIKDPELKKIKHNKRFEVYNFNPIKRTHSGTFEHYISTIYQNKKRRKANPDKKSKWLSKLYYSENIKTEKSLNKKAILEYVANNLSRIIIDSSADTLKVRLAYLPIMNKFLASSLGKLTKKPATHVEPSKPTDDHPEDPPSPHTNVKIPHSWLDYVFLPSPEKVAAEKYVEEFGIKKALHVMYKKPPKYTTTHYSLYSSIKDNDSEINIEKYIEKYRRLPETMSLTRFELSKKYTLKGFMGLLAASTSMGDVTPLKHVSFTREGDKNGHTVCYRALKCYLCSFFDYDKMISKKDPRDIQISESLTIEWNQITESQKNEFLEVKRYHLQIIKDRELLRYIFFRNGRFEQSDVEQLTKETAEYQIDRFISNVKRQGEIYAKDLEEYETKRSEILIREGHEEYSNGNYGRALPYYKKYFDLNCAKNGKDHFETGNNLIFMANAELLRGNYKVAEESFLRGLAILRGNLGKDHPYVARNLIGLGNLYDEIREYDKATEYYENAIEILKQTPPEDNLLIATAYNNLAGVYYNQKLWGKSAECNENSLSILKKILTEDDPILAKSYNNLGMAYGKIGKYNEAIECYKENLKILEKTCAYNHPSINVANKNLGDLYVKIGDFDEAWKYYDKCISQQGINLPKNYLSAVYVGLGNSCSSSDYTSASQYYRKALEIQEDDFFPQNVESSFESISRKDCAIAYKGHCSMYSTYRDKFNYPVALDPNKPLKIFDDRGEYDKAAKTYEEISKTKKEEKKCVIQ